MPRTKPLYIYPSKEEYKSLLDELIDIHNKIQTGSTDGIREQVSKLVSEVDDLKSSTSDTNKAIEEEINKAKGPYTSINDRFLAIDQYDVLKTFDTLSTTRSYEYKDGLVTKEKVRGDLNFDIEYVYDSYSNVIKETRTDSQGMVIGEKTYTYSEDGSVSSVCGTNVDDIMVLSSSLIETEHDNRLKAIESIDFVELGKVLEGWELIEVAETVQELVTQVQHLTLNLPENIGYLINTSELIRRIEEIEERLESNKVYYTFDVTSNTNTYNLPEELKGKFFNVFIEGLLLERGVDYVLNDTSITFLIPLIDGFTVSYNN